MHTHKKLDAESYEAAFLFNHFINSCHTEAEEECSSGGFWQLQAILDGACGAGRHSITRPRTRSVDQGISDAFCLERCSAFPDLSISTIKTFVRSKKVCCTDLAKSRDQQKNTLEVLDSRNVRPHSMQVPDIECANVHDPSSDLGFLCAYCDAKFRERRLLIKHLLGGHGTSTKMGLEPQSEPHHIQLQ